MTTATTARPATAVTTVIVKQVLRLCLELILNGKLTIDCSWYDPLKFGTS